MNYHGHCKLWQEEQLLLAEVHGAWSMETALDYPSLVIKVNKRRQFFVVALPSEQSCAC